MESTTFRRNAILTVRKTASIADANIRITNLAGVFTSSSKLVSDLLAYVQIREKMEKKV